MSHVLSAEEGDHLPIDHEPWKVDNEFWKDERNMLMHLVTLLKDFKRKNPIKKATWSTADECRHLEYEAQCLNADIAREGKSDDAEKFAEERIQEDAQDKPLGFDDWWQGHKSYKLYIAGPTPVHRKDWTFPKKCFHPGCRHYTYGFDTIENLNEHLKLSHSQQIFGVSKRPSISRQEPRKRTKRNRSLSSHDGSYSGSEGDLIQLQTSPQLHPSSALVGVVQNSSKVTCLRCKILKHRCTKERPCTQCPTHDETSTDYWKALGCSSELLSTLAIRCFPEKLRQRHQQSAHSFNLPEIEASISRWQLESENLRDRGWMAIRDANWDSPDLRYFLWVNEPDGGFSMNKKPTRDRAGMPVKEDIISKFGPALAVAMYAKWNTVSGKAIYNPFQLFLTGNALEARYRHISSWLLYRQAKALVVTATMTYEIELSNPENTIGMREPSSLPLSAFDFPELFCQFIDRFEECFSNRAALDPEAWLGGFYSLCAFSIVKSILIDTLSSIQWEPGNPWGPLEAVKLNSIFKVLVSVFFWSSKIKGALEPLVDGCSAPNVIQNNEMHAASRFWHEMIGESPLGDKSSKDFLMNLGVRHSNDVFNGFVAQRYRHQTVKSDDLRQSSQKLAETVSATPISMDTLVGIPSPHLNTFARNKSPQMISQASTIAEPLRRLSTILGNYFPGSPERPSNGFNRHNTFQEGNYSAPSRTTTEIEKSAHILPSSHIQESSHVTELYDSTQIRSKGMMNDPTEIHPQLAEEFRFGNNNHNDLQPAYGLPSRNLQQHRLTTKLAPAPSAMEMPNDIEMNQNDAELQEGEQIMDINLVPTAFSSITAISPPVQHSTSHFSIREGPKSPRPPKKPKSLEQREKTAKIRTIGACWQCKINKLPCDIQHERLGTTVGGLTLIGNDYHIGNVDIILVHGLDGDPVNTWTTEKTLKKGQHFWPRDLLHKDLPDARIMTFGYVSRRPSKITLFHDSGIDQIVSELVRSLVNVRVKFGGQDNPVIFIAHSLGGLVVKQALIEGPRISQIFRLFDDPTSHTTGIIFLGTAHQNVEIDGLLGPPKAVSKHSVALNVQFSSKIDQLTDQFQSIPDMPNLNIVCFYETQPTAGRIIVPEQAAVMRGTRGVPLETNHTGLCKFDGDSDPRYIEVKQVLKETIAGGI